jgi:hypothetical protein
VTVMDGNTLRSYACLAVATARSSESLATSGKSR